MKAARWTNAGDYNWWQFMIEGAERRFCGNCQLFFYRSIMVQSLRKINNGRQCWRKCRGTRTRKSYQTNSIKSCFREAIDSIVAHALDLQSKPNRIHWIIWNVFKFCGNIKINWTISRSENKTKCSGKRKFMKIYLFFRFIQKDFTSHSRDYFSELLCKLKFRSLLVSVGD